MSQGEALRGAAAAVMTAPRPGKWLLTGFSVAVVLVAVAPLLGTLRNGFVWDDHSFIEQGLSLRESLDSFRGMVVIDTLRSPYYRPVSVLWWGLQRALFGADPRGFHAVNLLLHAGAAALVLGIASRLLAPVPALLAALIFAAHPVHVEPVAFASAGGTELLPSVFFLGAVLLFLDRRGEPGAVRSSAAALLYLLALLSKEMAVGLPVLALVILWKGDSTGSRAWRTLTARLWPFAVAAACYALLRLWAMTRVGQPRAAATIGVFLGAVPAWLLSVARILLFPTRLLPYYELRQPSVGVALALTALLGAALVGLWRLGRARGWDCPLILGLGLLLLPLLPAMPLLPRVGAPISDRFLYLPSAGLALLVGVTAESAGRFLNHRWRLPGAAALLGVVVLLVTMSAGMVSGWRDDRTLFAGALSRDPRNATIAYLAAHLVYLPARDYVTADRLLHQVYDDVLARGSPAEVAEAWFDLGNLRRLAGDPGAGAAEFERALRLKPDHLGALVNLGTIAYHRGDREAAVRHWNAALAIDPANPDLLNNLGLMAVDLGEIETARDYFLRALNADPRYEKARRNLKRLSP